MSLYLWINLLSISVPLLVSFHPRIKLYKSWGALFAAIFVVAIPYLIWDIYFTKEGYWGFNEFYLSGIYIVNLPLEEVLFFICIPYACIFTHYSLLELNKKLRLSDRTTQILTLVLASLFTLLLVFNLSKAYTSVAMIFALVALGLSYFMNRSLLRSFFITFLAMLIPFAIVNGILTGTGIVNEVVWYNDAENLGIRMGTIPVEDTSYAFSLILLNLFLFEYLKNYKKPVAKH